MPLRRSVTITEPRQPSRDEKKRNISAPYPKTPVHRRPDHRPDRPLVALACFYTKSGKVGVHPITVTGCRLGMAHGGPSRFVRCTLRRLVRALAHDRLGHMTVRAQDLEIRRSVHHPVSQVRQAILSLPLSPSTAVDMIYFEKCRLSFSATGASPPEEVKQLSPAPTVGFFIPAGVAVLADALPACPMAGAPMEVLYRPKQFTQPAPDRPAVHAKIVTCGDPLAHLIPCLVSSRLQLPFIVTIVLLIIGTQKSRHALRILFPIFPYSILVAILATGGKPAPPGRVRIVLGNRFLDSTLTADLHLDHSSTLLDVTLRTWGLLESRWSHAWGASTCRACRGCCRRAAIPRCG